MPRKAVTQQAYVGGAISGSPEIDFQWTISIQRPKSREAVAQPPEKDWEIREFGRVPCGLQFGGSHEPEKHSIHGFVAGFQADNGRRRGIRKRLWVVREIELLDALEPRRSAAHPQTAPREFGQSAPVDLHGRILDIEDVQIYREGVARREGLSIELPGPEDKWARPISEPAGNVHAGGGSRLEDAVINLRGGEFTQDGAKSAPHDIAGLAGRNADWAKRAEVKAKPIELERVHDG